MYDVHGLPLSYKKPSGTQQKGNGAEGDGKELQRAGTGFVYESLKIERRGTSAVGAIDGKGNGRDRKRATLASFNEGKDAQEEDEDSDQEPGQRSRRPSASRRAQE